MTWPINSGWTDERIALLTKLWAEGKSASQCAAALGGVSRNAAIGKLYRMGLSGRYAPVIPGKIKPPVVRAASSSACRRALPPKPASKPFGPPRGVAVPAVNVDLSHAKPWTERAPHGECCFPVETPEGETQLSCCAPALASHVGASAYCPAHAAAMFDGAPKPNTFRRAFKHNAEQDVTKLMDWAADLPAGFEVAA